MKILASPYLETRDDNPVLSLLYHAMEEQGAEIKKCDFRRLLFESWDVWHLHWPELQVDLHEPLPFSFPFKLLKFWIKLKIARAKQVTIFWTVHNLRSHERYHPILERIFLWVFVANVDGIICMTKSGQEQLHSELPLTRKRPVFIIPHGHYRGVYPDSVGMSEARNLLNIGRDETVVAFIGQVKAYKGIPHLIRCFNDAAVPASRLLIVGRPQNDQLAREISEVSSGKENVQLHLSFVAADQVQTFLRAANLVVLPYKDILNSGSAILALSFDRPILVPDRGAMGELHEQIGPQWVWLYSGELTPQILHDAILWAKNADVGNRGPAPLEVLNWDRIATLTKAAFSAPLGIQK